MVLLVSPSMFQDPGLDPGHSPVDSVYGNLQIVFSFIFWSRQIITTERTQQQSQEQIQDLKQDQEHIWEKDSRSVKKDRNRCSPWTLTGLNIRLECLVLVPRLVEASTLTSDLFVAVGKKVSTCRNSPPGFRWPGPSWRLSNTWPDLRPPCSPT